MPMLKKDGNITKIEFRKGWRNDDKFSCYYEFVVEDYIVFDQILTNNNEICFLCVNNGKICISYSDFQLNITAKDPDKVMEKLTEKEEDRYTIVEKLNELEEMIKCQVGGSEFKKAKLDFESRLPEEKN